VIAAGVALGAECVVAANSFVNEAFLGERSSEARPLDLSGMWRSKATRFSFVTSESKMSSPNVVRIGGGGFDDGLQHLTEWRQSDIDSAARP
jgi:hypothetical protein